MPVEIIETPHPAGRRRLVRMRHNTEKTTAILLTVCGVLAATAGAGGLTVAIVGLSGQDLFALTAVAAIAIGAGMMAHGIAAAARSGHTFHRVGDRSEKLGLSLGLLLEVIGGAGGATLGIVALGGISPYALLPVATIVLGSAAMLVAPAQRTLSWMALPPVRTLDRAAYHATKTSAGLLALAGAGAVVLGILALLGLGPLFVMSAAGMIAIGGALFIAGAAIALRFGSQLDQYPDTVAEAGAATVEPIRYDRAKLIDLLTARLAAGRTGARLHASVIEKLRSSLDPELIPIVPALERHAASGREHESWLEEHILALGGDVHGLTSLAVLESREHMGIEDLVVSAKVHDPLHLLHALQAAELSDADGWTLLAEVADEIEEREMRSQALAVHREKQEQLRFLGDTITHLASRRVFENAPVDTVVRPY